MSKSLKFIHITKCAGSFIEDVGKYNNINWGRFDTEYGYWHDIFSLKPHSLKNKYDWFMIIRNPYDRILSEYYCEWGGIGKKNITHTKEQFNQFLIYQIKHRSISGEHYTEQYKYLDKHVKINIIRFENLNAELDLLFNKYNIPINVFEYRKQNTKESKNRELKFTKYDFSKELILTINDIYDKDFEEFNYEKIPSGIIKIKKNNLDLDYKPVTIHFKL